MSLYKRPKTRVERDYETYYAIDVEGNKGQDQVIYRHPNGLCVVCLAPSHPLLNSTQLLGMQKTDTNLGDQVASSEEKEVKADESDNNISEKVTAEVETESGTQKDDPRNIVKQKSDDEEMEWRGGVSEEDKSVAWRAMVGGASVDFAMGKTNRLTNQPTGKRKRGGTNLEANSSVCVIQVPDGPAFKPRACLKGKLLEVNDRLVAQPQLLIDQPKTAGFLAILMPRPEDFPKMKASLLSPEEYHRLREIPL